MAAVVFLHIGLPKTATTYLQTILWGNREVLEDQQLRLPGEGRYEHLWATRTIREDPAFEKANERRRGAWERLRADVAAWPGTALISHEFFAAASAKQADRMVADLAPAEVHLVVTGREPLGLFTASWQESIKNRDTTLMADYSRTESDDSSNVWNWRTLDIRRVLERWSPLLPAERVHVLPLPGREAPRREIWDRFATLVGVDPDSVDLTRTFHNASMGVAEAETLRRINHHLGEFNSAIDRGTYIRTYLADERLVPRRGDPFWPDTERIDEIRQRGTSAVAYIAAQGFDVIGDLDTLLVPVELPERRVPESVTEREVATVAVELAARMLHDVRDLRQERRRLRHELAESIQREDPGLRVGLSRRFPVLRHLLLRGRHPQPGSPGA
ncbi:MAG: hypothetical protein JWR85_3012 [Marmoricola sp.]|nr:hypothetical protein [Marmoricola sp.]